MYGWPRFWLRWGARRGGPGRRCTCAAGDRKSLQPIAARLGLPGHDQLQHFIASPAWDDGPLRAELARSADRLVGGSDACLVIDDTALPKNLSNLPPRTTRRALAGTIKACQLREQVHQQLTEELGLDHFEGRSWTGLHRHALMTCIACADLQHLRLAGPDRTDGGKRWPAYRNRHCL